MSTKSLGQQDIAISQRQVGTVRVLAVYPHGQLYPRMHIRLGCLVQEREPDHASVPPIRDYRLRDLRAELRLSEHADAVAELHWIDPQQAGHSSPHPHEWHLTLTGELNRQKVELLDRQRDGGNLKLYLKLWPIFVSREHGWYDADILPFAFDVPRDEWLALVAGLGIGRRLVLEVPYSLNNAEAFGRAAAHLERALGLLDEGHYNEAINICRLAADELYKVAEARDKESFASYLALWVGERRAREYANCVGALRRLMEMTHHISSDAPRFSRSEAVYVLQSMQHVLALVGAIVTGSERGN